jgi:hypothetical protein
LGGLQKEIYVLLFFVAVRYANISITVKLQHLTISKCKFHELNCKYKSLKFQEKGCNPNYRFFSNFHGIKTYL